MANRYPVQIDGEMGENKHGLNITVNNALSPYEIKKRKPETE
jgi:hypothetical protein